MVQGEGFGEVVKSWSRRGGHIWGCPQGCPTPAGHETRPLLPDICPHAGTECSMELSGGGGIAERDNTVTCSVTHSVTPPTMGIRLGPQCLPWCKASLVVCTPAATASAIKLHPTLQCSSGTQQGDSHPQPAHHGSWGQGQVVAWEGALGTLGDASC